MKTNKWTILGAALLTLSLTACGKSADQLGDGVNVASTGSNQTGTTTSSSNTTTTTSGSSSSTFSPSASYSFTLAKVLDANKNYDADKSFVYQTQGLVTDSVLKVRVKAAAGTSITDPLTGQTIKFTCVGLTVNLYIKDGTNLVLIGSKRTNPLMAGGSGCSASLFNDPTGQTSTSSVASGVASEIVDFSSYLPIGNSKPYVVEIESPTYDFYCQLWWKWYRGMYPVYMGNFAFNCPLRAVYQEHNVKGSVEVQVNAP